MQCHYTPLASLRLLLCWFPFWTALFSFALFLLGTRKDVIAPPFLIFLFVRWEGKQFWRDDRVEAVHSCDQVIPHEEQTRARTLASPW